MVSGEPGDCEDGLVEQVCYGYGRASNRTHRAMPVAARRTEEKTRAPFARLNHETTFGIALGVAYDMPGAIVTSGACLHPCGHTRASALVQHSATILRIPDQGPAYVDTKTSASGRTRQFRNR